MKPILLTCRLNLNSALDQAKTRDIKSYTRRARASFEREREIYETVLIANLTSIDEIVDWAKGANVHQTAVGFIEKAGYGEYFILV